MAGPSLIVWYGRKRGRDGQSVEKCRRVFDPELVHSMLVSADVRGEQIRRLQQMKGPVEQFFHHMHGGKRAPAEIGVALGSAALGAVVTYGVNRFAQQFPAAAHRVALGESFASVTNTPASTTGAYRETNITINGHKPYANASTDFDFTPEQAQIEVLNSSLVKWVIERQGFVFGAGQVPVRGPANLSVTCNGQVAYGFVSEERFSGYCPGIDLTSMWGQVVASVVAESEGKKVTSTGNFSGARLSVVAESDAPYFTHDDSDVVTTALVGAGVGLSLYALRRVLMNGFVCYKCTDLASRVADGVLHFGSLLLCIATLFSLFGIFQSPMSPEDLKWLVNQNASVGAGDSAALYGGRSFEGFVGDGEESAALRDALLLTTGIAILFALLRLCNWCAGAISPSSPFAVLSSLFEHAVQAAVALLACSMVMSDASPNASIYKAAGVFATGFAATSAVASVTHQARVDFGRRYVQGARFEAAQDGGGVQFPMAMRISYNDAGALIAEVAYDDFSAVGHDPNQMTWRPASEEMVRALRVHHGCCRHARFAGGRRTGVAFTALQEPAAGKRDMLLEEGVLFATPPLKR